VDPVFSISVVAVNAVLGTSGTRKSGRLQSNFWNFFPENRFWSLGWGLPLPCFPTPTEKVKASQAGMFKVCLALFRERKLIYRPTDCMNSRSSFGNALVQTSSSPGSGKT
jgi:hypothetical protein